MGEEWYALRTREGKEREALKLLKRRAGSDLFSLGCIPRKMKIFRSGGVLHSVEDVMFPGYVFIKTAWPAILDEMLEKAGAFPQFFSFDIGDGKKQYHITRNDTLTTALPEMSRELIPVEEADLAFLKNVCGESLQSVMGLTRIGLNHENRIVFADGVLHSYLDRIVKLNLHKRFAVVDMPLFNRNQPVVFGILLEQD